MKLSDREKVKIFDALGPDWSGYIPILAVRKALDLYTLTDVAAKCGVSSSQVQHAIACGRIDGGGIVIRKNALWTAQQAQAVLEYFCGEGMYRPQKGKFGKDDVDEMRRLYASGMSQTQIARKFLVNQATISRLIRGVKTSG